MPTTKKILSIPLRISVAILLLGMLLRILHWSYASQILLIAFVALGLLYIIRFWKKSEKKFLDYVKLILITFWSVNGIFHMLNLPYVLFFQIVIAITFLIWFVMEGTAYFLDEERKSKNNRSKVFWNFAMVIGTIAIIAGSLLNLLEWQFAIPLLIIGILIVAAYILKDVFDKNKINKEDHGNEEFQL
jgi:hypothetical protein